MAGDGRLLRLVAGHLILGVVATHLFLMESSDPLQLAHFQPLYRLPGVYRVLLYALVLCQAVLLALWGTYAGLSRWRRTVGLIAVAACPEGLLHACSFREESLGLSKIAMTMVFVTAAVFLVGRALGVRLIRETNPSHLAPAEAKRLRLSIRGLMLFTAVVAILIAVARSMRWSLLPWIFLGLPVWVTCFFAVGPAATWAALGGARPRQRGMIALALVCGA